MNDDETEYPIVYCPRCGAEQVDMDGFGFLACIPGCGWCTHPSGTNGQCDLCGERYERHCARGAVK